MAAYFVSDVHLRLDEPGRGRRLARLVGALEPPDDTLTIGGDLCDFWLAARQCDSAPSACDGLRALAGFRKRGGSVTILLGNHDAWLGPFYQDALGFDLRAEPLDLTVYGLRVRVVHGHLIEPRRGWKAWMESRAFLRAFEALPDAPASTLDRLLQWKNLRGRPADERRYHAIYRRYVARCRGAADLVIVGHVHTPLDEPASDPRLIIPGSWHTQSSYVRIDESGATLIVESDESRIARRSDAPDDRDSHRGPPIIRAVTGSEGPPPPGLSGGR